jgi:ATP-dependent RNA helicase DHX36
MKKQARVFKPAPQGKRKVILSTNIAETSVTIDDVVYVVDCGRINISRYIPLQKAANLTMEWISQSNALQRAGRAGRVQAGKCWHMFSRARWCELEEYLDPDIKRQALEEVIINIKSLHLPWKYAAEFMDNLIESPKSTNVNDAVDLLVNIEAINDNHNEQLTPLGHKLAHLPLHPQLGKMLVLAALFKCVDPILTIVAILNEKDPFMLQGFKNRDKLDKIRRSFSQVHSSMAALRHMIFYKLQF